MFFEKLPDCATLATMPTEVDWGNSEISFSAKNLRAELIKSKSLSIALQPVFGEQVNPTRSDWSGVESSYKYSYNISVRDK
jgi:hypothetical protein